MISCFGGHGSTKLLAGLASVLFLLIFISEASARTCEDIQPEAIPGSRMYDVVANTPDPNDRVKYPNACYWIFVRKGSPGDQENERKCKKLASSEVTVLGFEYGGNLNWCMFTVSGGGGSGENGDDNDADAEPAPEPPPPPPSPSPPPKPPAEKKYTDLTVCNKADQDIWLALAYRDKPGDKDWILTGWWKVAIAECKHIGEIAKGYTYFHGHGSKGGLWGKHKKLCVEHGHNFTRSLSDGKTCSGKELATFTETKISTDKYTHTFTP